LVILQNKKNKIKKSETKFSREEINKIEAETTTVQLFVNCHTSCY
jgi:hypothetical protein